jgi:hypothetical protein
MNRGYLAAAVLAIFVPVVVMSPAAANVERFDDSLTDQGGEVGIRWVQVDNSSASLDKIKVLTRIGEIPSEPACCVPIQALFLDTRPNNPGPEYRVLTGQDIGLYRVDGWHDAGRFIPASCAGSAHYGGYVGAYPETGGHYNRILVAIKRGCVGNPGKIRVAVHAYISGHPQAQDWAKARKTFLPWLRR